MAVAESPHVSQLLAEINEGEVDAKLTLQLREVSAAVEETGRAGEIVVKIKVRKEGKHAAVRVESSAKKPYPPNREEPYFFAADGGLTADDPRQIPLRGLDTPRIKPVD